MTKIQYTLAIRHSLSAEELNFSTYVLMLILVNRESMSIARLAADSGMGYAAVKNQVYRTPWFKTFSREGSLLRARLSAEGREKLTRIETRIQEHA